MVSTTSTGTWATFGELLRYLRRRAGQTQRELGIAVGYSEGQIARLEGGQRPPDLLAVKTVFVEALGLAREPELARRLLDMAIAARNQASASAEGPAPPASPAPQALPTNLPAQLTRFIGREREVAEVRRLLGAHRLLTLTGSGGVGKTRLAIEVGFSLVEVEAGAAPAFPDGVWLAELAPLADAALVPRAVAEVFRLPDVPGRSPAQAAAAHLMDKHALLILDNCEHVIAACAELTEALLRTCPHLRILTTSREALRAASEVAWRVPSLSTPDPTHLPPLEHVLDYEAIRLFAEHAAAAQPSFQLTAESVATIAQICARLDGIPLAIEMAAAQVAVLSIAEIAARLDDRFRLLTSGSRTALPRQRTLQATLEWSYHLLSEPERLLLARLAAFADGCTADAAQAACADALGGHAGEGRPGTPLPTSNVLPLLLELVRKSLVVADTRSGRTRFRLLETVRQFALGKLSELGGLDAVYERLAAYLLSRPGPKAYEYGWAKTIGLDQLLEQLEAELGNVRALMAWARARPDGGEMSLHLATALSGLWVLRGHLAEPQAWLEEALARVGAVPAGLRVGALNSLLRLLSWRGYNLARYTALAEESLALSEQIDDAVEKFESLWFAGRAALHQSDLRRAEALFEQGLALARREQHLQQVRGALWGLAVIRLEQGDNPGAASLIRQSLQVAHEDKNGVDAFIALYYLAVADQRAALALCEREVSQRRAGDNPQDLALFLNLYAELLLAGGHHARARDILNECLALWRALGVQWILGSGMVRTLLLMGQVAWLQGDPAAAETRYKESLDLYRHVGDTWHTARLLVLIGYAQLAQGNVTGAAAAFREGLDLYRELGRPEDLAAALVGMGALAEARGQAERAARLFAAAGVPRPVTEVHWPADTVILEREIAAARQRFDRPPFAAAWAAGEKMTLEHAVAYALQGAQADTDESGQYT